MITLTRPDVPPARVSVRRGSASPQLGVLILALPLLAAAAVVSRPPGDSAALVTVRRDSARTIRFQVTEGTWMSLDVSPDGRTIVFDLLGDLYLLPITGGKARPLTSGRAFDAQPRFSPDGRRVAFISDRSGIPNLWVMDRDGRNPRQLSDLRNIAGSPVSSPTWAPDGCTIVVSQRLGATGPRRVGDVGGMVHERRWLLASYDAETGAMRWITDTSFDRARSTLGPVVAPDGHTIYASVEPYRADWNVVNAWRVERIDRATGAIVPMVASRLGRGGFRPEVSRDGRFLAYVSSSGSSYGLRVLDLKTLRERWVVPEEVEAVDYPYGAFDARDQVPGYAFTPNAAALIIAVGGKIRRIDVVTGRSIVVPFSVDVVRELAPATLHQFTLSDSTVRIRSVMQPTLSPDGNWVAFSALNRVWVMKLASDSGPAEPPRRLTADSVGEFYPSWSPDGEWIAYSTWCDRQGGAVRRIRARRHRTEVAASERLTTDRALYFHTAFSLDGRRIIVVRANPSVQPVLTFNAVQPPESLTVSWLPSSGGVATPIAKVVLPWGPSRLPVEQLYVTKEPDRIYLGLSSFNWHGTDSRVELLVTDSEIAIPSFGDITGVLSPNGQRALITHRWALSEITRPRHSYWTVDTLDVEQAQMRPFGAELGAATRWGRALAPWISWSGNGHRVLFNQGGMLFVGDIRPNGWTAFRRVAIPLRVPVDVPRGTLALCGARIITMRKQAGGASEVIERGDLVVRDNRILAVGPAGTVLLPAGAHRMSLAGKTVLPGYVDTHDHPRVAYGVEGGECWPCLTALAYGVTASRNPAEEHQVYNDVFSLRDRERAGELVAPRIFSTGIPHFRDDRPIRTLGDAKEVVGPLAQFFDAETFKEYTTSSATRVERQLVAEAAAEAGLNATIHTEGIPWGLTAITDGFTGIEHTFTVRLYDDVATFIAKSGAIQTHTFGVMGGLDHLLALPRTPGDLARALRFLPPSARREYQAAAYPSFGVADAASVLPMLTSAAHIVARGGCVGMGSHGNFPGIGFHHEMWLHALGGMSNAEVLRAATACGAAAIGHTNDFGSLEPGKLADLQVLDANPLEDIHNTVAIHYVMKNGRLYNAEDLAEVWPRQKRLGFFRALVRKPKVPAGAATAPASVEEQRGASCGSLPAARCSACMVRPGR